MVRSHAPVRLGIFTPNSIQARPLGVDFHIRGSEVRGRVEDLDGSDWGEWRHKAMGNGTKRGGLTEIVEGEVHDHYVDVLVVVDLGKWRAEEVAVVSIGTTVEVYGAANGCLYALGTGVSTHTFEPRIV